MTVSRSTPSSGSPGGGIVLFDGTCAFCEGAVRFIARRDPDRYFRFGASQTPAGEAILAERGVRRESARSLVLVEDGAVYLRSTASLRIARHLGWPWRLLAAFLLVPAPLRDPFYQVIAAIRHRVAGRSLACELPPPELRDRMIQAMAEAEVADWTSRQLAARSDNSK
jgi:predicted DCC family thiol-disulfide oxidoreductase YuxK